MRFIFNEEQQFILDNMDKPMQVSAGAGSGKTRVLVERYYRLISRGVKINRILAVTFTRKAAGEMLDRIRKRIAEDENLTAEEKNRQQEELAFAYIGTIHSICARLIRENPLLAGVDPYFGLLDEVEAYRLKMDIIRKTAYEQLEKDNQYLKEYIKLFGFDGLLSDLYDFLQLTSSRGLVLEDLLSKTEEAYGEITEKLPEQVEKLKNSVLAMEAAGKELKEGTPTRQKIEELMAVFPDYIPVLEMIKTNPVWDPEIYEKMQELSGYRLEARGKAAENIKSFRENLNGIKALLLDLKYFPLIKEAFFPLAADVRERIKKAKEARNLLDFDDLEEKTLSLLRNHPDVLDKYRQQFTYIMVDEYQDINYRQYEIFRLLSDDFKKGIFTVGDPKQSIYRFRGAKVELFGQTGEKIGESGINAGLNRNYRTLSPIIDFINDFCARLFTDEAIPFAPLQAERIISSGRRSRLYLLKGFPPGKKAEAQACLLADVIKDIINEEILLPDEKTGEVGRVNYGDIALLFRTTANMPVFARILRDYGIPCRVIGSRDFFLAEEVKAMLRLLEAIADAGDEISLVGALRSFLFQVENETLWLMRQKREPLREVLKKAGDLPIPEEEKQKLKWADHILAEGEKLKDRLTPSELIRYLEEKTCASFIPLKYSEPAQKKANLNKLAAMAWRLEEKGVIRLKDFLAYMNEAEKREIQEKQAAVDLEGDDRVKLMTVHQSKGLEFPVVIIPELEREFNEEYTRKNLLVRDEEGIFLRLASSKISSEEKIMSRRHQAVEGERRDVISEQKRLIYVALTRSRDLLILAGIGKFNDKENNDKENQIQSWRDFIQKYYTDESRQIVDTHLEIAVEEVMAVPEFSASTGNTSENSSSPSLTGEKVEKKDFIPVGFDYISPTRLVEYAFCPYQAYFAQREKVRLKPAEEEETLSSARLGNIVHYLAEKNVSLSEAGKIVSSWSDLSEEEKKEALKLFAVYLEEPEIKEIREQADYKREVPFLVRLEDFYLRGVIDGLGLTEDKIYIIDLKTGKERDIYDLQLAFYEKALQRIMPEKEIAKLIFYLQTGMVKKAAGNMEALVPGKLSLRPVFSEKCEQCRLKPLCKV
ncbi:ATP-dependent exoDNAse (exonuclease V) beta subunit (contains helicase and exonuclease domains) [Thermosyntropha lipolytica DSM 11003]|uniref:DNA 3'-5' helicase n=1 Tax=Thermosyntropha lipolytica DSM 11003 TaxID=1123382 RepID=A0A1M5RDL7_9FIRM|nr:UvrD-helicase domain-containing protein [Thermosyntropha lipolytica]SHH24452.1 ATP-dependent exoDNAse (exonuclease V) beta subunit (contains helicase and exonuclease domains) [Thermosyntropha lipolytica DSM 11003]